MSVTVQFSISSKRENSTLIPTMRDTAECTFKNGCSMLNPTLLLNIRSDTFPDYTFFKIGNRIYKVTDIRTVRNDLFEISGVVDVLATYKNEIGASTQYILRSASSYDTYIQDNIYPARASTAVEDTKLTDLTFTTTVGLGTFIIGVISEDSSGSAIAYYSIGSSNLTLLMRKLFDPTYLNASDITTELQKELLNPMQYIVSCNWFPFIYDEGTPTTVKFGWWDSTVNAFLLGTGDRIYSTDQAFTLPSHPQSSRGSFLNDSPYTRHMLHCYSFGSIPINPSPFVRTHQGHIYIEVDMYTGTGQLYITCNNKRIMTNIAQIGVPIQLSQSNANIIGSAVAAIGTIGKMYSGNILGASHGIATAIIDAMPQVQTQGANGSIVSYTQAPNIISEFREIANEDNPQIGKPLCAPRTISSLSGYILCEKAEIAIAATKQEKDEILNYLNTGFFYE